MKTKGWMTVGMMVTLSACGGGKVSEKETKELPSVCSESDLKIQAAPSGDTREAEFRAIPKGAFLRAEKVTYAMTAKGENGTASFRLEESFLYSKDGEAKSDLNLKCQSGLSNKDSFEEMEGMALVGLRQEDSVARPDLYVRKYKLKNDGDRVSLGATSVPKYIGNPSEELEKAGWIRRKLYQVDSDHYELRLEHTLEMDNQVFSQWMVIRYQALHGKSADSLELNHPSVSQEGGENENG